MKYVLGRIGTFTFKTLSKINNLNKVLDLSYTSAASIVTRLGDIGFSLSKSTTFLGKFCKAVKFFNFSSEIILGNFFRRLGTFYWSHWRQVCEKKIPSNQCSLLNFGE